MRVLRCVAVEEKELGGGYMQKEKGKVAKTKPCEFLRVAPDLSRAQERESVSLTPLPCSQHRWPAGCSPGAALGDCIKSASAAHSGKLTTSLVSVGKRILSSKQLTRKLLESMVI